jgi:mRNA interferase MazF
MRRGEVWWADLPAPVKPRPVVVLTRDAVLGSIGSVVVGLVTRTARGIGSEVPLGVREGLLVSSVLNLDNILTVPRQRLIRQMGALSKARVEELDRALKFALQIEF